MTSDINSLFTSIQSTLFLLNITKHSSQNSFNSENLHLLYKKLIKKLSVNLPRPVQPSANIDWNSHQTEAENSLDSPCSSKICFYLILLVISILKHKGWNPSYLSCDWLTKNSVRGHELPARASLRREATSEVFSLSVFSSVVMSFSSFSFPLATLSMPSSTVSLLIRRTTDTSLVCPTR